MKVLVTGGTGTVGLALIKHFLKDESAEKVIVFSRDEHKQHILQQELSDRRLRFFIGDVRDKARLMRAFIGIDTVIHAAAMKHVAICEYNPHEAVQTNITGTQNVVDAAIDCGVKRVLHISTDKAVNPVSLYGSTKACAERLAIDANNYTTSERTRISCLRMGNIWASRGSVIEMFKMQMEKTGKLTITDPDATRYFITPEDMCKVAALVIQHMEGREIFIPYMKKMTIMELANSLYPGASFVKTKLRRGEKKHEDLYSAYEEQFLIKHENYLKIKTV